MTVAMQQTLRPLSDAYALAGGGRLTEAIHIIRAHAKAGDGEALFALGDIYWRGVGVEQDLARGRDLFRRASEAGQPAGIRAYTNLLANGFAGPRDWSAALIRLRDEARTDRLRAWMLQLIQLMDLDDSGDPIANPRAEQVSSRPQVTIVRQGFTFAECDYLRTIAEPTYQPSKVATAGGFVRAPLRTSDGSTLHPLVEDPATHALNRRLAAFTGTDVDRGEPLQILRYRPGQEYRPHVDWLLENNLRIMTALVYLNDDYAGGETAFVKAGIKIKGWKGDVLLFRSQASDGGLDPLSEHAGLPVTSGTKYLASRWIRAAKFVDRAPVMGAG